MKASKLKVGSEIGADIKLKGNLIFRILLLGKYSEDIIVSNK